MNENCTVLQSRLTSFKVIKVWFHSQKLFWILLHNSIQVVQDGIICMDHSVADTTKCLHSSLQTWQDILSGYSDPATQHYLYPEITFYKNLSLGLQIKVHRYKKSFYVKLNWSCSFMPPEPQITHIYAYTHSTYIDKKLELSENSLLLSSYFISIVKQYNYNLDFILKITIICFSQP